MFFFFFFFLGGGGFLKFLGFFCFVLFWGGCTVDAGPEPTYEEKMRVPPPPLGLSHDNH